MEAQRYQVTQDDQDYIVSVAVIGDKITLECQDNNIPSTPIYGKDYTLYELRSYSKIFDYTQPVMDVENEIINAIENHKVSISNQGNIIEIIFDFEYIIESRPKPGVEKMNTGDDDLVVLKVRRDQL